MFKSLSLFVIALFAWVSCVATANEQIRIRDIFEFDEDISVEIHSVSHQIVHYGSENMGNRYSVSTADLEDLFAQRAEIGTGAQINYSYDYIPVYVEGVILQGTQQYHFVYSLAGHGSLSLEHFTMAQVEEWGLNDDFGIEDGWIDFVDPESELPVPSHE